MVTNTATRMSNLSPNGPVLIPAPAYLAAVEDFSPEWWHLVQTCPGFRAYWLRCRERFDSMELEQAAASRPGDDTDESGFEDLLDMELQNQDFVNSEDLASWTQRNDSVREAEDEDCALEGVSVNELISLQRTALKHWWSKIFERDPLKQGSEESQKIKEFQNLLGSPVCEPEAVATLRL